MSEAAIVTPTRDLFRPRTDLPPIFQIQPSLNPFGNDGVKIFGAPLYGPLPSLKEYMVRHLLEQASVAGRLKGIKILVEASSGNTGAALTRLAKHYGIFRVVVIVPEKTPEGKLRLLRRAGAEISFPDPHHGLTTVEEARRLGGQAGWLNLDQYHNFNNYHAHEAVTGPHVWRETAGKISVFSAALGTTGTVVGVSHHLRPMTNVHIVGVAVAPGEEVSGARTLKRLGEVGLPWRTTIDGDPVEIGAETACRTALALQRQGHMVGPTSGLALAGLLKRLAEKKSEGQLDNLRNASGEIIAVFVCGDGDAAYREEFARYKR